MFHILRQRQTNKKNHCPHHTKTPKKKEIDVKFMTKKHLKLTTTNKLIKRKFIIFKIIALFKLLF